MVNILPPAGWQAISAIAAPAEAGSSELFTPPPAAEADAPTVAFVETATPTAPVAAAGSPFLQWGAGGAALLLVGGLVAGMWLGGRDATGDATTVAAAAANNALGEPPPAPHDDSVGDAVADERDPYAVDDGTDSTDEASASEPDQSQADPIAATDAKQSPVTPSLPELPPGEDDSVTGGTEPAAESIAATLPSAAKSEASPNATPPKSESRPAPVLKFDPLDFDPANLSLAAGASTAAAPSTGSIADDPASETDAAAAPSINKEADEIALPPPAMDRTLAVRLGPMASVAAGPNRAAGQLALRVESLDVADIPLARFVAMVSDMAGVPITLDPVALELAGASARQTVTVQAIGVTLEKLLRDALVKQRLELIERDGRLSVALANADRRSSREYEVKDLVGAGGAKQVAELVERFVAPNSWQAAGGKGTIEVDGTKLRVEHLQSVHHQVLIFCERLRLARGLVVRSRYPVERLNVESPYERIAATLNQRATFTFLPWTRLAEVVRHWEDASGLTILVDWSALADAELGPSSPLACSAIDRTWGDVLDGILEPIGLGWWAVDGETIRLTTREALDEFQRIEFYAVPKQMRDQFKDNDALIESLQKESQEHTGSDRVNARFALDEPSGRLIVLAPPDVQRVLSQRLSAK